MNTHQIKKALEDLELLYDQFLRVLSEYSNHIDKSKSRREMIQFEEPYKRLKGRLEFQIRVDLMRGEIEEGIE